MVKDSEREDRAMVKTWNIEDARELYGALQQSPSCVVHDGVALDRRCAHDILDAFVDKLASGEAHEDVRVDVEFEPWQAGMSLAYREGYI